MTTWQERVADFEPYFPMKARRREATDADFERLETAVGGALPADYRTFVRECGGIGLEQAVAVLEDGGARRGVEVFFGFGEAKYGFDLHGKLERFSDRLPSGLLPIAADSAGNLFLLVVTGDDAGAVLLWDHDGPRKIEDAPPWLRARIDAELQRRGRPGTADDLGERWAEIRHDLPWWECLWRAAPSFDAFIAGLQRAG
jgi:hypothetical protein